MAVISQAKLQSDEHHWTLVMISQHWFRYWLGAVRQQAITWTNVDQDPCHHMASLGHNELKRQLHTLSSLVPHIKQTQNSTRHWNGIKLASIILIWHVWVLLWDNSETQLISTKGQDFIMGLLHIISFPREKAPMLLHFLQVTYGGDFSITTTVSSPS